MQGEGEPAVCDLNLKQRLNHGKLVCSTLLSVLFLTIVLIMKGFGVEYTGQIFGEIYSTLVLDMSKLVCIPLVVSLVVFFANQGRSL